MCYNFCHSYMPWNVEGNFVASSKASVIVPDNDDVVFVGLTLVGLTSSYSLGWFCFKWLYKLLVWTCILHSWISNKHLYTHICIHAHKQKHKIYCSQINDRLPKTMCFSLCFYVASTHKHNEKYTNFAAVVNYLNHW